MQNQPPRSDDHDWQGQRSDGTMIGPYNDQAPVERVVNITVYPAERCQRCDLPVHAVVDPRCRCHERLVRSLVGGRPHGGPQRT